MIRLVVGAPYSTQESMSQTPSYRELGDMELSKEGSGWPWSTKSAKNRGWSACQSEKKFLQPELR